MFDAFHGSFRPVSCCAMHSRKIRWGGATHRDGCSKTLSPTALCNSVGEKNPPVVCFLPV